MTDSLPKKPLKKQWLKWTVRAVLILFGVVVGFVLAMFIAVSTGLIAIC